MLLKDKVALITGAGDGIGKAIAIAMAEAGAQVVAADIDMAAAQATADDASKYQVKSLALEKDVGDVSQIDAMIAETVAAFGRLDIIVNNAGVTRRAYIMDLTEEDWDRIHRVNAKGVFFCLQRAAQQMMEQGGGCIINIASIAGRGYAGTSNAAYAASKGAVIALTKTAAQQLGPHNINVNSVCPGVTMTPLGERNRVVRAKSKVSASSRRWRTRSSRSRSAARTIPRILPPLPSSLASPGARNITGQSYNVDGGLWCRVGVLLFIEDSIGGQDMKAGFIGTGSMGAPLAANLLDQKKSLVAYDINPEATVKLAKKQARIVDSPVAVADESDLVFACMPSIESFRTVIAGDEGVIHGKQMKTFVNSVRWHGRRRRDGGNPRGKRGSDAHRRLRAACSGPGMRISQ